MINRLHLTLRRCFRSRWIILIIFILGLLLRFWLFTTEARFAGDSAKDLLAGYHIVKYGEFPLVGHTASGNSFYYPPYYFYLHGLLYLIFNDPRLIIVLFITWQSLSILFTYSIGEKLFDKSTGLFAAFLIATAQFFVREQSWLFSGPSVTPLFLFSLLVFFKSLVNTSFILIIFSLTLILVAGFINYAILIYLPLFLLFYTVFLLKRKHLSRCFSMWIFAVVGFILLASPLFFSYQQDALKAFNFINFVNISGTIWIRFIEVASGILQQVLNLKNLELVALAMLALLIFSAGNKRYYAFHLLIIFFYPVFLYSIKQGGGFAWYYFDSVIPIAILLLVLAITNLYQFFNYTRLRIVPVILFMFLIYQAAGGFRYVPYENNQFGQTEKLTRTILTMVDKIAKRNNRRKTDFFQVSVYQPFFWSYNSPMLLYQLERMSGKKFSVLVFVPSRGMMGNFLQTNSDDVIFLYCLWYPQGPESPACQKDFLSEHNNYVLKTLIDRGTPEVLYVFQKNNSTIEL